MLAPKALKRVQEAPTKYAELMQIERAQTVRMVAVPVTRGVSNHNDFFAMTHEILASWGAEAGVTTGEEEAALSFHDIANGLEPELGPCCITNVDGGSTGVTVDDHDDTVAGSDSVAMDNVRLIECSLQSPPPTAGQIQKVRSHAAEPIDEIVRQMPANEAHTIVSYAGAFTVLSALAQGLEAYDPGTIHLSQLRFTALHVLTASVIRADAESPVVDPVVHPKCAGAFAGGSIVVGDPMDMFEALSLSETAEEKQRFFYISEKDILDGIVTSLVDAHITR